MALNLLTDIYEFTYLRLQPKIRSTMQKVYAFIFSILFAGTLDAQGIEFFHGSWEEALQKAYEEEKVIFVDAYATWCGPCKTMAKYSFTDEAVGEFYNEHFINIKLDMEKEEGLSWRQTYPVTAYPTLYYIDAEGEVVLRSVGSKKPADLLEMGEKAAKGYDSSKKYAEKYEEGDRSYDLMYNYIRTLNKANKPSLRIANEYLNTQSDLSTEENLKFILEAATRVDSKIFGYLENYKKEIIALSSEEVFRDKVMEAAHNTVQTAVEYEAPSILEDAKDAVKKHVTEEAEAFEQRSMMDYALAMRDPATYETHAKVYLTKHIKDDADKLLGMADEIEAYYGLNNELLPLALKAAEAAFKLKPTFESAVSYASLLNKSGDLQKALKVIEDQIEATGEDERQIRKLQNFKKGLKET